MKKTTVLTQLAIAGITAGLVFAVPAHAENPGAKKSDSTRTEKAGCKSKAAAKGSDKGSCGGPGGCGAKKDSALGRKIAADSADEKAAKAKCRGLNACKGQGGCAMSEKQLDKRAKELGIPREKAGKAHSCKGLNECKGLGGCKM